MGSHAMSLNETVNPETGERLIDCYLRIGDGKDLFAQVIANAPYARRMAQPNRYTGDTLAICGAGPSLANTLDALDALDADQVWACNSALPYLVDHGRTPTSGFAIDQGVAMLKPEEWGRIGERGFPTHYFVASSIHPDLRDHLIAARRKLTWFHNYLGSPDPDGWTPPEPWPDGTTPEQRSYESWLYTHHYATSVQVGHGLNSVPRAVCLALYFGFAKIVLYGADCACAPDQPPMPVYGTPEYRAWMRGLVFYADGRTAADCYTEDAVIAEAPDIDGRRWHTRADMVMSAQHLLQLQAAYPDRITFVGDTLVNAIRDKGPEFMANMPTLSAKGKVSGFGSAMKPAAAAAANLTLSPEDADGGREAEPAAAAAG